MDVRPPIPEPVRRAVDVWLGHHDRLAPGLIRGVYIVGSVALDDSQPGSDIDIVAFTDDIASGDEVDAMRDAHLATHEELGDVVIDGPRVSWRDVADAPTAAIRPWSLDGEFHHDDACFELNPVAWHTLAHHGLAVRGPDAKRLSVHLDAERLHDFVIANTGTYWRSVADAVTAAATDPDRTSFDADAVAWSTLGVARMLRTVTIGDVVSKSAAGDWIIGELPEHRKIVEHALSIRHDGVSAPCSRSTVGACARYLRHVVDLVGSHRRPSRGGGGGGGGVHPDPSQPPPPPSPPA